MYYTILYYSTILTVFCSNTSIWSKQILTTMKQFHILAINYWENVYYDMMCNP